VAAAASEQSGRSRLPLIHLPKDWRQVVPQLEGIDRFLLHTTQEKNKLLVCDALSLNRSVAVMIGPEGGFVDEEIISLSQNGWQVCSLGTLVLRMETAVVAALARVGLSR
jgi:16S rRNA (uracil1498-N3)-methyltransferase